MKNIHHNIKQNIKNSFFSGRTIAAILVILLFLKQRVVYITYGSQIQTTFTNTILIYLGFFGNDMMILAIILFFVFININIKSQIIKIILNSISGILLLLFFIDIVTIYYFQSRLSIFELYNFFSTSNGQYFFSYIAITISIFTTFCILIFFFTQKYLKKIKDTKTQLYIAIRFLCISLCVAGVNFLSYKNKDLAENILSLNIQTLKEHIKKGKDFINKNTGDKQYTGYFEPIKGKNQKPNIILVFAESFSTIDSQRAGGLYNNLPLFDKIQSQGTTFTNFFANGCTSETAHIALLQGVEPRENPLMDGEQGYEKYIGATEPLPNFLNNLGYQTTFISSVTLDFLDQKDFLSGLKFQTLIGEEAFKNKKKYVFNAAPDLELYNKALDIQNAYQKGVKGISGDNINKPYFITVQTISSHKPYDTPYGSNEESMLKYVDRSLYTFYQKLKKSDFFNNGILIIVGDHRKMENIGKDEFQKFGLTSKSRALATIIGKGIKENTYNNNIIQHTDIYNSIRYLVGSGNTITSTLYNNIFNNQINRDRGVRYCRFSEKTYAIIKSNGEAYTVLENQTKDLPIINYINSYKKFQAEKLLGLSNFTGYHAPALDTGNKKNEYTIIAHAGGPYNGRISNAANTFLRAEKDGIKAIEFDISYTKDGENVVLHGPNLNTTTCGPNKYITGYTLQELQKDCKLKNGEKILTLEDFLKKMKGKFDLSFLEIKVYDNTKGEEQALKAIDTVTKLGMQDKIVFISYDRIANYIIGSHKKIRAGRDSSYTEETQLIYDFPHEYYLISKELINQNSAEIAQAMGKKLVVYTVNTKEDFEKVTKLGAKMIMTDNIPLMKNLIDKKNKQQK